MTAFTGATPVLGSPKGGEDKPEPRTFPTHRCTECQLLRVYSADAICGECFDNKWKPYTP